MEIKKTYQLSVDENELELIENALMYAIEIMESNAHDEYSLTDEERASYEVAVAETRALAQKLEGAMH